MPTSTLRVCPQCGRLWPEAADGGRSHEGQPRWWGCSECRRAAEGTRHQLARLWDLSRWPTAWWRLGVSTVLAGQGMLLGLAVNLSDVPPRERLVLHLLVGMTSLLVVLLLGWPLLQAALQALSELRITVELLFLAGIGGAVAASIQSTVTGAGAIYFEVVSVLLVVYSFSKMMIAQQRSASIAATRGWLNHLQVARLRLADGKSKWVPAVAIQRDDVVEVQPGEWVPVDGIVASGQAFILDTPMTGEPFARAVQEGDTVLAGYAVEDATLLIRATVDGTHRRIDELIVTVERARATTTSLQRHADRLTQYFLPFVLTVCMVTFVMWTHTADWQRGLMHAMSVLLVACPCALGLATPLAVWSTLSHLAEQGLVLRQAHMVESLASIDHVVCDKTGTLTEDRLYVADIATQATGRDRARLLSWLAAVESSSSHPVARALAGTLPAAATDPISDVHVTVHGGLGIRATFRDEQGTCHTMQIGRPEWIQTGLTSDLIIREEYKRTDERADNARVDVALDGRLAAVCCLRERVREATLAAIAALERQQIRVTVLTGDRRERGHAVGLERVIGDLGPRAKAALIEGWQREGQRCLYVGDGTNDGPALCVATAAVALSSGTELAQSAAPAILCHGNLGVIPQAVQRCRQAVQTVQSNLIWAATYNAVGIGIAAAGWLHPIGATVLMVGSSLFVSFRSLRLCEPLKPGAEIDRLRRPMA